MKERYNYIDRLKGITILLVVMVHLTNWTFIQNGNAISFVFGPIIMPVFFFLSGVVVTSIPDRHKLRQKLLRYLSPFFVVGLSFALLLRGIDGIGEFFHSSEKTGYWYLYVLAIFYCILTLLRFNNVNKSVKGICVDCCAWLGFTMLFYLGEQTLHADITDLLSLDRIREQWPFFFFGYMTRKYDLLRWFEKDYIFSTALISIIPLYFLQRTNPHTFIVISTCIIISFTVLFRRRTNETSFLENELTKIGKGSLDIYIFHYFFLRPVGGYRFTELGEWLQQTNNWLLEFFILTIIAVLTSYCCLLIGHVIRQSKILSIIIYCKRLENNVK